jgi:hypothetical protein
MTRFTFVLVFAASCCAGSVQAQAVCPFMMHAQVQMQIQMQHTAAQQQLYAHQMQQQVMAQQRLQQQMMAQAMLMQHHQLQMQQQVQRQQQMLAQHQLLQQHLLMQHQQTYRTHHYAVGLLDWWGRGHGPGWHLPLVFWQRYTLEWRRQQTLQRTHQIHRVTHLHNVTMQHHVALRHTTTPVRPALHAAHHRHVESTPHMAQRVLNHTHTQRYTHTRPTVQMRVTATMTCGHCHQHAMPGTVQPNLPLSVLRPPTVPPITRVRIVPPMTQPGGGMPGIRLQLPNRQKPIPQPVPLLVRPNPQPGIVQPPLRMPAFVQLQQPLPLVVPMKPRAPLAGMPALAKKAQPPMASTTTPRPRLQSIPFQQPPQLPGMMQAPLDPLTTLLTALPINPPPPRGTAATSSQAAPTKQPEVAAAPALKPLKGIVAQLAADPEEAPPPSPQQARRENTEGLQPETFTGPPALPPLDTSYPLQPMMVIARPVMPVPTPHSLVEVVLQAPPLPALPDAMISTTAGR